MIRTITSAEYACKTYGYGSGRQNLVFRSQYLKCRVMEEVILKVCNGYAQPEREHTIQDPGVTFFSYPGYYKTIVDNIGIVNGIECSNRRRILREDMFGNLIAALKDSGAFIPCCCDRLKRDCRRNDG